MAFGTDAEMVTWLGEQGMVIPANSPAPAVMRARGSTYINSVYGPKFCGQPTGGFQQADSFPRTGATAYGQPIPDDVVPTQIVHASYRAGWLDATGVSIMPAINPHQRTKREKVDGAVEREFFDGGVGAGGVPLAFLDPTIDGMLAPFICSKEEPTTLGLWAIG